MLTSSLSSGPVVVLDESAVRDAHVLRAEARRLRDFFLREAANTEDSKTGLVEKVVCLTFTQKNLASIASMLHQLANIGTVTKNQD